MQKVCNLLGVLGFVMSGTMAVMGVMAYTRVPSMVKNYASELKAELTKTILEQVPSQRSLRCQSYQRRQALQSPSNNHFGAGDWVVWYFFPSDWVSGHHELQVRSLQP